MRPSLVDTPPVCHAMAQIQPTPVLMCGLDWKDLTDHSIQILDSSEFMKDESMLLNNYVTNHIRIVDTFISPKVEETRLFSGEMSAHYGHETLISVDSMSDNQGLCQESRIIFTPTGCASHVSLSNTTDRKSEAGNQIKRSRYSDSDITMNNGRDTPYKHTSVARSKSVGWADSVNHGSDYCMVKPLLPSAYETKIGGVKRIQSFRSSLKPEIKQSPLASEDENIPGLNESVSTIKKSKSHDTSTILSSFQGSKFKIARFVRNGLKSVRKSKDTSKKVDQTEQFYDQELLKKRQRGPRYSSAIGGLSEFLRKVENRRKTLNDIPELPQCEQFLKCVETKTESQSALEALENSLSDSSDITPSERIKSTGTSNLKFARCQRKLSFKDAIKPSTFTSSEGKSSTVVPSVPNPGARRPRLGLGTSKKPVQVMPIDSLEMEVVIDLKRKIEKSERTTRIKTNGSLKPRTKPHTADTVFSQSPIWRKSFRYRRVQSTKPSRVKIESLV